MEHLGSTAFQKITIIIKMSIMNNFTGWFKGVATNLLGPITLNPENLGLNNANKYTQRFHVQRTRQDVQNWRQAIYEAEMPYVPHRVKMQAMYKDSVLNGHLMSCIRKRKNLTLLKEYEIVDPKGNVDENATEIFKKKWFAEALDYILDAQFYGYSLINWTAIENGVPTGLQLIRREYTSPDRMLVSNYPYSLTGMEFDSKELKDWVLWISTPSQHGISPCGFGLLYEIANYEILLRNILGYNADYVEKYGMPMTEVKTSKRDDDERQYLEDALMNLGASGTIIHDPVDEISFLDFKQMGNGFASYGDLEQRLERKISKVILGHADAMDAIPGMLGNQGVDTPISRGLDEAETIDNRFVEYHVNDILIPKLQKMGVKIPVGYKFKFKNGNEALEIEKQDAVKNKSIADYLKVFDEAGFSVEESWLEEKTGIPLKKVQPLIQQKPTSMVKKVVSAQNNAPDQLVGNKLPWIYMNASTYGGITNEIAFKIFNKTKVKYDYNLFKKINNDLQAALNGGFSKTIHKNKVVSPLNYNKEGNDLLHDVMRANVIQFSAGKTTSEITDINNAYTKDLSWNDFRGEVAKVSNNYNENHLKTEYNTAYSTALNSKDYLDKKDAFNYVIWRQIDRATARPEHAELADKVYKLAELDIIPPTEWNCGCELEYITDEEAGDKTISDAAEITSSEGFNNIAALTGDVFPEDNYGGLEKLTLEDKGLTPVENLKSTDYISYVENMIKETLERHCKQTPDEIYQIRNGNAYTDMFVKFFNAGGEIKTAYVMERYALEEERHIIEAEWLSEEKANALRKKAILTYKK